MRKKTSPGGGLGRRNQRQAESKLNLSRTKFGEAGSPKQCSGGAKRQGLWSAAGKTEPWAKERAARHLPASSKPGPPRAGAGGQAEGSQGGRVVPSTN